MTGRIPRRKKKLKDEVQCTSKLVKTLSECEQLHFVHAFVISPSTCSKDVLSFGICAPMLSLPFSPVPSDDMNLSGLASFLYCYTACMFCQSETFISDLLLTCSFIHCFFFFLIIIMLVPGYCLRQNQNIILFIFKKLFFTLTN